MEIPDKNQRFISWGNILFVILSTIGMITIFPWYLIQFHEKSLTLIIISIIYSLISGLSISAGYHRYYCHKSFEASKLLQLIFLTTGGAVWQGPLANWISEHKLHHMYPEGNLDPYPIKHGFWWAYLGWLFYRKPPILIPEVLNNPLIMWQYKYYKSIAFLFSFGLGAILGYIFGHWWEGALLIGLVRSFYFQHVTFLINTWGHLWGNQNSSTNSTARNHHLLAFLTLGEGYHNNHHVHPQY